MSPEPSGKSTGPAAPVLAVDTGGTFTDLLLLRADGSLRALKVPSTPDDPAKAVLGGAARLLDEERAEGRLPEDAARVRLLLHGSTVATNTLLERKGARVALVTNRGFEDVIEIGRQDRPQLYALTGRREAPLVERDDRIGIAGRMDPAGREVEPLDASELERLPGRLRGAEAVAVVLLHSYANPGHEKEVAAALAELGVPLSISSAILPEFREYERTATTLVNAYVAPVMTGYLERLDGEAPAERVRIMGSAGGALPLRRAVREPVRTILSGPAGGVVGALWWARRAGLERVLSFDMGGTSTDVAFVPGRPLRTREGSVGGVPVSVPLLDIHTVGAGGGSLAWVDPGGALRVGPRSAGADPGPVAYGRGGSRITVTDAHVHLGRLPPEGFLGGAEDLDPAAIRGPLEALARETDRTSDELAEGIVAVANTAMERALRVISVERGIETADVHLVAFGGAAGLHAAELVERLGLAGAVIPPDPGLLSAYGMLVAPVVRDRSRTVLMAGEEEDGPLRAVLAELERDAREGLEAEGIDLGQALVERHVDARYRGQSFELEVPSEGWVRAFHRAHRERYGYAREENVVEAVTARVRVRIPAPALEPPLPPSGGRSHPSRDQEVIVDGRRLRAPMVDRSALGAGDRVEGPALVLEYSSTTWCPPGWIVEVHPTGILRLSRS